MNGNMLVWIGKCGARRSISWIWITWFFEANIWCIWVILELKIVHDGEIKKSLDSSLKRIKFHLEYIFPYIIDN